jgi:hypothetical protein
MRRGNGVLTVVSSVKTRAHGEGAHCSTKRAWLKVWGALALHTVFFVLPNLCCQIVQGLCIQSCRIFIFDLQCTAGVCAWQQISANNVLVQGTGSEWFTLLWV